MRRHGVLHLAIFVVPAALAAQTQPAPTPPAQGTTQTQPAGGRGRGPNFPQQQRPLADAAVLARGQGLYGADFAAWHGIDLRGGQQGGPNLLRSQTLLSDKAREP